jgi:hypothetical protein
MIDPSSPSQKFKCLMVKAPLWWFFLQRHNDVIFWLRRWIQWCYLLDSQMNKRRFDFICDLWAYGGIS